MYEYAIRVLEAQIWFENGLVDVISNPKIKELQSAIKILKRVEANNE